MGIVNPPQNIRTISVSYNYVQNGGFETGSLSPWVDMGFIGVVSVISTNPHTGTYCLSLNPTGNGAGVQQTFPLKIPVNNVTAIYFWYRQTANNLEIRVIYADSTLDYVIPLDTTGSWHQQNISLTNGSGELIDHITVIETPSTSCAVDDFVIQAPLNKTNSLLLTYPPQS